MQFPPQQSKRSTLIEWLQQEFRPGIADFKDDFERETYGFTFKIIPPLSNAGLLQGIGVGLVVAIALFVINYSRINVIRDTLSGATDHSNAD